MRAQRLAGQPQRPSRRRRSPRYAPRTSPHETQKEFPHARRPRTALHAGDGALLRPHRQLVGIDSLVHPHRQSGAHAAVAVVSVQQHRHGAHDARAQPHQGHVLWRPGDHRREAGQAQQGVPLPPHALAHPACGAGGHPVRSRGGHPRRHRLRRARHRVSGPRARGGRRPRLAHARAGRALGRGDGRGAEPHQPAPEGADAPREEHHQRPVGGALVRAGHLRGRRHGVLLDLLQPALDPRAGALQRHRASGEVRGLPGARRQQGRARRAQRALRRQGPLVEAQPARPARARRLQALLRHGEQAHRVLLGAQRLLQVLPGRHRVAACQLHRAHPLRHQRPQGQHLRAGQGRAAHHAVLHRREARHYAHDEDGRRRGGAHPR